MCFGNDGPDIQKIPEFKNTAELMDVVNKYTGTQSVIVTGPDGKKRRVNEKLPYTPEEARKFELVGKMISTTLGNISTLYKYEPKSAIDFAPIIDVFANMSDERIASLSKVADFGNIQREVQEFKQMQDTAIREEYAIRNFQNDEALSHTGRSGGSYAVQSRANMQKNEIDALARSNVESTMYGEDLAAKRLGTNTNVYNLQESGRQGQLDSAMGQYGMLKQDEAEQEARRTGAIKENQNQLGIGMGVDKAELDRNLQNTDAATSLNQYNMESNANIAGYNANVNAISANNRAAQEEYNNRPPGMGEILGNIGGQALSMGANYMTGGAWGAAQGAMGGGGFNTMMNRRAR